MFAGAAVAVLAGLSGWRGDLHRDLQRVGDAAHDGRPVEPLAAAAMARHPVEPWFPFVAGVDLGRRHDPVGAVRYLNRALLLDRTAWKPHQAIGEALWQAGRPEQAILEYRLAYQLSNYTHTVLLALVAHGVHFQSGLDALAGDDPALLGHVVESLALGYKSEDAALAATRLLELRPDDLAARRWLARVQLQRANSERDLAKKRTLWSTTLDAAEHLPPREPETTLIRVRALDGLGRSAEADAQLEADFAAAPANPTAFLLAERAIAKKRPDDALAALTKVQTDGLSIDELARFHHVRGRALEEAGNGRDAILELTQAARIDPTEDNRLELAAAFERSGLMREALLRYRAIVRSSPSPSASLRAHVAHLEHSIGLDSAQGAVAPPGFGVGLPAPASSNGPGGETEPGAATGEDDSEGAEPGAATPAEGTTGEGSGAE
jgi:Flp pilus assembly protein TadD